jgi:hypothetical protein
MAILIMTHMSSTAATGSRTTRLFHWRIIKNAITRNTSACAFDSTTIRARTHYKRVTWRLAGWQVHAETRVQPTTTNVSKRPHWVLSL